MQKIWNFAAENAEEKKILAGQLGISEVLAGILLHRGFTDQESASCFLAVEKQPFHDPGLLKDMDKAVSRIETAISKRQRIVIYGDYDVDGITATALLVRALRRLDAIVDFYIPDRQKEGYGFNPAALEKLAEANDLLISVDCGISAVNEIASVREMDVIITDHHLPGVELPPALAVVNPHREDCSYPDKNLAGVGVAFKLCQALWQKLKQTTFDCDLELVALGTIADIVPLLGENRRIVKSGLAALNKTEIAGLAALIDVCDLEGKRIDAGHVGFVLAPRLNAAGRLASAAAGVDLLLKTDVSAARRIATELNEENIERQLTEREILEAAEAALKEIEIEREKVLVLAGENWHSGVIGIVASRIVEKYYKPVIIIGIKDGIGKGSCRSIRGFHMYEALADCEDLLLGFGGHAQAAGLSILPENIPLLRDKLSEIAATKLTAADYIPVLDIEASLPINAVEPQLIEELAALEPYGMGNPRPLFACQNTAVRSAKKMGREGAHLRLELTQGRASASAIAWNKGEQAPDLQGIELDVAFQPELNVWQGRTSVQLKVQDLRPAEAPFPTREEIGRVYLLLKGQKNQAGHVFIQELLLVEMYQQRYRERISGLLVRRSVKVLQELHLLQPADDESFRLPVVKGKCDLMDSPTFAKAQMKQN